MAKSTDDVARMLSPSGSDASTRKTPNKSQSADSPIGVQPYSYDDDDYNVDTTEDNSQSMAQSAADAAKGSDNGGTAEPGSEY